MCEGIFSIVLPTAAMRGCRLRFDSGVGSSASTVLSLHQRETGYPISDYSAVMQERHSHRFQTNISPLILGVSRCWVEMDQTQWCGEDVVVSPLIKWKELQKRDIERQLGKL